MRSTTLAFALKWIEPRWSREIEQTLADPEIERARGDFIASLDRLIELIHEDLDRKPVLIIDDI